MLSNVEYAESFKVPVELSAEMAEMALFTCQLNKAKVCVGRNSQGKRVMKTANPKAKGNLFAVTPIKGLTLRQAQKLAEQEAALDKAARLALYASRGYAFDENAATNPHDGAEEISQADLDSLADEYEEMGNHAFNGTRKGGVVNHSNFEGFVDSAQ